MKVRGIGHRLTSLGEWAGTGGRRLGWSSVLDWLHRRGQRATGSVAVSLVGAVAAASVVTGMAAPSLAPRLANVGAWLGSSANGTAVHVNGLSGRLDGRVALKNAQGHPLRVVQDGSAAYVVDEVTGQVSRIDPSQLQVADSRESAKGAQVVAGAGVAYVVDPVRGEVQRIDPSSLATMGPAIKLQAPLGHAGLDGDGELWVLEPGAGQVVGIEKGGQHATVRVGQPGDVLGLTIANGTPVVTDGTTASAMVIGGGEIRLRTSLPSEMTTTSASGLLVPATTGGPVVPVLSPATGDLALVDTSRGSLTTVGLGVSGDKMGAPQMLGQRVYVPDETTGSLVVYDAAAGVFEKQVPVTGHAGPLEAFEQGGLLWVNDQNSAAALVVEPDGSTHPIGKYEPQVPGPAAGAVGAGVDGGTAGAQAVGPPGGATQATGTSLAPGGPGVTQAPPGAPPPPARGAVPADHAPTAVTATSGSGSITITFTRSSGATPTGYVLLGAQGFTVQPAVVGPAGPFQFQVTGGSCAQQYAFQVEAQFSGGATAVSAASVPVRPCVAPGAPQGFRATAVNHGADLTWQAPVNASGSALTYSVSWDGGSRTGLTGLAATIGGLTNGGTYTFRLTAADAAGSSLGSATASATLVGPPHAYRVIRVINVPGNYLYLHSTPFVSSPRVGAIPPGRYPVLMVLCQAAGSYVQDPTYSYLHGSIWDRVSGYGPSAYVSDLYVGTPQSAAGNFSGYSDPPLWQCT